MTLNANALLTPGELETELGISFGASDISQVEQAINEASSMIDDYVGYQIAQETGIVEKVDGTGTPFLYVRNRPLTDITSITFDGLLEDSNSYEIHGDGSEGAIYNRIGWIWTAAIHQEVTQTPVGGTERKLYTVTYTAGYTAANMPASIKRAARLLASSFYQTIGTIPGIKSERIGRSQIVYDDHPSGLPLQVRSLLASYKLLDIA